MKEKIEVLQEEFEKIKAKGYIKGIYNSSSSIGRTFEQELGLPMNKESTPDYNGIEIKTRRAYTKNHITLFSAVPDGKDELEIKRLKDRYGYPYYKDRHYKCLYAEVYANQMRFAGIKYQYKIIIDNKEKRVYLAVYSRNGILVERRVYWSFEYLKEKLENKLSYLALVHAWPNKIDNWNYFKYYKITFYKLKSFNKFLKLLEVGRIKLTLKVDIYLDEANYGKMYDHGCSFSISEKDLELLFTRIIIRN